MSAVERTAGDSPVEALVRPKSLAQRAYAELRSAIRAGRLVLGEVYSESDLAQKMGISRTPVREALIELQREGLVEIRPQRGFQLRAPTADERTELFGLRLALESYVVETLTRSASKEAIATLRDLLARQKRALKDRDEFFTLDEQFHLGMPDLLGFTRTHQILAGIRGSMWLMARHAMTSQRQPKDVLAEHRALVDAIAAGDVRAAKKALQQHLALTVEAIERDVAAGDGE